MPTVILVSVLAPVAGTALLLAARGALPKPLADARGIALQTVIVIVVMLAIAGAVAGVLLSTGSEVTGELEAQDLGTTIDTQAECTAYFMGREPGAWTATGSLCTWQHDDVSLGSCRLTRSPIGQGAFTATSNVTANQNNAADNTDDRCVLDVA